MLTVLQRFETIQALQVVIFLRSVLSLSFINDDLMFGSREDINRILLAVDATVAVGFSALAARRSLWRSLMYMHMDRHALTFENVTVGMCKELFRFALPELIIMAEALGLYGRTFRIPTGHSESRNWYTAEGETILLALLLKFADPGRLVNLFP
jgi:hypothetical protein